MERSQGEAKEPPNREGIAAIARCYQGFDPAMYLRYNYTPPRADFTRTDSIVPWKLACLHQAFTEGESHTLVDVGSGPTLYQVLSGCEVFGRVVLTDFLEANRRELQRWLAGEQGSFDWTPYLQHVCQLEGRRAFPLTFQLVLPIDVHQPCPLPPGSLPASGADCLVSSFCLESVSPDVASFTAALRRMGSLLRPGGHVLLIGALGESYYMAAPNVRIPVVPLDEAQVCSSLKVSGLSLLRLCVYTLPPDMRVGVDDVSGIFFVKARKP
uniref:Phenylethanolamine N-methyltransferase n=1 Tax=Scleropages formosus TaxID=113540 RepID=A0A8C9RGF6_SCLFO